MPRSLLPFLFTLAALMTPLCAVENSVLPGELTANEILNGTHRYPASPRPTVIDDATGFARERLSQVPKPGVHPRILISPEDLPGLRQRIAETQTGRRLIENLRARTAETLHQGGTWENDLYNKLAEGKTTEALALLNSGNKPSSKPGHYQPYILYALVMESFDALLKDDAVAGKKIAAAVTGYARMIEPLVDARLKAPLADDVWRIALSGPTTGNWSDNQGIRDLVGYHNLGYAYDFAFKFMDDGQRAAVRRVISKVTSGRIWMGAQLPRHFRNWNWVAVGLSQPLLALAIEGEEGSDSRVYRVGVEIAHDYLTYGISSEGASTEAVGYTQFGLVWGNPFFVACARRGENFLVHGHHRKMVDWYLHSMEPWGGVWTSHGDGGDGGPSFGTLSMWKYFYPTDQKIDFLWRNLATLDGNDPRKERIHVIEPLLWASDGLEDAKHQPIDYAFGAVLKQPLTWFDPQRSSLIARSAWSENAAALQFECRTDSVGASHEHADRGNFTFSALGRQWARESFRSVETRHHNCVLIDGMGQGYWPGPGKWLGMEDNGQVVIAACDAKEAYGSWWPKQIVTEDPSQFVRFPFSRWASYGKQAEAFRKDYGSEPMERDQRPSVVAHFKGFEAGDPRMWDEDGWPVRLRHQPVQRAVRSVALARGKKPYALIVDDIQKDDQEHLYEWLMMTGPNTEMASVNGDDIVLCDATTTRDALGIAKPKRGDRLLLVRTLKMADPAKPHDYQARPSARLEAFEKRDTNGGPGGRSFGLDKRLVIASRSKVPEFTILLFPMRQGDPLPVTAWNEDRTLLTVECSGEKQQFKLLKDSSGQTRLSSAQP